MVIGLELGSQKNITLSEFSYLCRPQNLAVNWQCRIFSSSPSFSLSENRTEELFLISRRTTLILDEGMWLVKKGAFSPAYSNCYFLCFWATTFLITTLCQSRLQTWKSPQLSSNWVTLDMESCQGKSFKIP